MVLELTLKAYRAMNEARKEMGERMFNRLSKVTHLGKE